MALLKSGTRIYGNATIDTVLAIDGNTSATSNSTGALTVAGGVGIAGNIYSTGNLVAYNANLGNAASANYFVGDGSLLTNIAGSYSNANVANYLPTYTGNFTASNVEISGNLIVNGTVEYTNVTNLYIKDAIIEQGGGSNGAPLTTDDNKDRGSLLHYYDVSATDAFIGWKNANSEFVIASNVSTDNNVVTINQLGNLRGNVFIGNLSGAASTVTNNSQPNITSIGTLANLSVTGDVNAATITGTLTTASQPNITSLGTLSTLSVSGLKQFGNVNTIKILNGNANSVLITDGTGNVSWTDQVANSLVAGTVYTNSQPNITSVGALTNLSVSGNISVSKGIAANGSYGNLYDVLTSDGYGNTKWKARYYYSTVMYDFTDYGMGYQTIAPNQDPVTLGFLANVTIPHGSIWMLVTNDGLDDPAPITITSPNSKATPMMWVTIDGSGPYDPVNNPNGGDYWFNITPPA